MFPDKVVCLWTARITFLIVISFLNFCVLLVMLGFEFKRLGCHCNILTDKKVLIVVILAIMQLRKHLI